MSAFRFPEINASVDSFFTNSDLWINKKSHLTVEALLAKAVVKSNMTYNDS